MPIKTLSPVQIRTIQSILPTNVGSTGVAVLNPAGSINLHSYHTSNGLGRDFDVNSKIYLQGSTYFEGNGGLFQAIDFPSSTVTAVNTTGSNATTTFTPSSSSNDSASPASGATTSTTVSGNQSSSDADNAIAALSKYYYAGWEYLLVEANDTNHDFITKIAAFVQEQERKIMVVDIPTENNTPDFSWTKPFKESSSILIVSGLKSDNYNFGASLLSEYVTTSPMGNLKFVPNLDQDPYNVVPQAKYEFGDEQVEKYYAPYHAATLAYTMGGETGLTDNHVSNVMQVTTPRVRDYIADRVQTDLTNVLKSNYANGLHYDAKGIALVQKTIDMILQDCVSKGYIESYTLFDIDISTINEYKRISGLLELPGYKYVPMNNIGDITVVQNILVPEDD